MNATEFNEVLLGILGPSFPGLKAHTMVRNTATSNAQIVVHKAGSKNLVVRFAGKQFDLERAQAFSKFEVEFTRNVAKHITKFNSLTDFEVIKMAAHATISDVVANTVAINHDQGAIIASILSTLEKWSSETYEGNGISVAFVVEDGVSGHPEVTFDDIAEEDFAKVVSNGYDTVLAFDSKGHFSSYLAAGNPVATNWECPFRYTALAAFTNGNNSICIALNRHGEILLFKNGVLQLALRRGTWVLFDHLSLKRKVAFENKYFPEALRLQIYATALDVSFARCGGCIGFATRAYTTTVLGAVNEMDHIVATSTKAKSRMLASLPTLDFGQIDRRMRQEIVGIDGATIINSDGTLLTAGAIISYPKGSPGGGRTAAATELSKFGIGFKISADGKISAFHKGKYGFQFG
jgi:hypothetical protein